MGKLLLTFIFLLCLQYGSSQEVQKTYSLVISHVNIVDVQNGRIIADQLLAINGDTIKAIDAAHRMKTYQANRYLDAQGRFVLPGLWDMHVHFFYDTLLKENRDVLPLFLANGVTAVREAGTDILSHVKEWQKQISEGELDGPKIFTSGLRIDGKRVPWPGFLKVETPAEVTMALDTLQKLGIDVVKLYDANISRSAYLETLTQAKQRRLKTSGHLPLTVAAHEAVEKGLCAFEHLEFALVNSSPKADSICLLAQRDHERNRMTYSMPLYRKAYDSYSPQLFSQLISLLAEKHVAVVPTLTAFKNTAADLLKADHSGDTMLQYISPKIVQTYQARVEMVKHERDTALTGQMMSLYLSMIPEMQRAGVLLLAGTDCGPYESFIYPGQSLHEELKLMVQAGLTPAQALQTATINPARFMGVEGFYGTLQVGKSADLLFVDSNPLDDIAAIDRVNCVVSNGKLFTRSDLNGLLQSIRVVKPTTHNPSFVK